MIELNHHKESEPTTHNRVFTSTSISANQLAQRWNCSKQEVYRWLVEMALNNYIISPPQKEPHDHNMRLLPTSTGNEAG